ncbi:MAG: protein kinase, partial [Planctomycetota bacterium]
MKPEITKNLFSYMKDIPASDPDTKVIEASAVNQDPKTKNLPSLFLKLSQEFHAFTPLKNTLADPVIRDYFSTLRSHNNLAGAKILSSVGGAAEIAKVPILGKWFALKSVLSDIEIARSKVHFQPRYALEQILNEAMVLDEIGYSKHIINIHYYGWFPNDNSSFANRNFVLLDFCTGGDLSSKSLRSTLFQNQSRYQHIVQAGYEMALALNTLRQLGVIHRDIKPRNIL